MSAPSTPRTTRSASAAANSPEILTPGRKIKAMLAAFDSDSESDSVKPTGQKPDVISTNSPKTKKNPTTRAFTIDSDSEDEGEDDDIIRPRGRMAVRLQGHTTDKQSEPTQQPPTESAIERVSKALRAEKQGLEETRHDLADEEAVSSDDDLPAVGPKRRDQNVEMMRDADEESVGSRSRARSFSPLFMSSPTRSQDDGHKQREMAGSGDDEVAPKRNNRFLELVAKKRREREEKERVEAEKKAAKAKEREAPNSNMFSDDESADDGSSGKKKPAQLSRPARKAGKKALEEMSRETQRMSRNMQLTHEARTKKKITKESFFARFNFMQPQEQTAPEQPGENSSTTAESQHSSDVEAQKDKETPQTSPVLPPLDAPDDSTKGEQDKELNFPTVEEIMSAPAEEAQKLPGDGKKEQATEPNAELSKVKKGKMPLRVAPVRVRLSREQVARHQQDDSDSDLEIVTSPAKSRRIAAFENLPARNVQEPASMFRLKTLAQLTSPSRKSTMNSAELSANLLHQAKQQAGKERRERIEELRAKGIVIETAAERAAFEDEVENLVEKARQEGEDIAKKERAAAKKENGGGDDDDDDSDFALSGSEDEGDGDADPDGEDEEMEDEAEADKEGNQIDSEAGDEEDENEDEDESEDEAPVEAPLETTDVPTQRRKRPTRVLSDDEEDEEDPAPKTPAKPINPFLNSVERPNIPVKPSDEATMSLTQAFAGTLAPSQAMSQEGPSTVLASLPEPVPMSPHREPGSPSVIKDSQEQRAVSMDPSAGYWQPDPRVSESPARSISQMSQIPDPTQDAGFVFSQFDPNKRFMGTPTSTIETVLVEQNNSPVAARKMRNLRRGKAPELSAIEEQEGDFEIDASAFDVMKTAAKKAKKPNDDFDRKKSKAKDVVEEAAEESDDEYAGLGGASDDDADDEENAFDREMINDNSGEKVDAKQLAALNALHQKNADEKDVAKLLKDITTGALRRRRGADDEFDLDDSDDEMLARRRQKQREFARMRNALLADGKVGELAENPKKAAFFKAVEDRDDDDDAGLDFLDSEQEGATQDDPSSQDGTIEAQTDSRPGEESNKRKRPLEPAAEDVNNRPPPHLRRKPASAMSKKPATLAEIRETVSFLTERPEYDSFQEDASVDEDEGEQHANDDEPEEVLATSRQREPSVGFSHPRRTRGPVVDRLTLLRQASSNSATSASSNTRFAFHTGAASEKAASFGFKPPILRKTTTASSSSSTSDSSRGVTKAGGASVAKKGSVNYYTAARERERERQLRTQHRNRGSNITVLLNKHAGNRLGALGGGTGQWE
ncbi:MRC1-like domain-containing protein [Aspergillus aurantiobrunneus]